METIGFIGIGKIGLPICEHLLKSGYRVVGYRRSSLRDFAKLGGVAARSAADVGEAADIVFMCLPSDDALEEVVNGPAGLKDVGAPGPDRGRIRIACGSGQEELHRVLGGEGCRLPRW
jgi:3-hydroxyisobutyrate dehydrogenase-like beta-hydroxyacid dehydrogenase